MKTVIPFLFFIILIPALAKAQDDSVASPHFHKYFADSSLSVITIERDTVEGFEVFKEIAKTQSYHLVHYWDGLNLKTMLISQTSTQTTNSNTDGEDGIISFIAKTSDGGNFNKTVWTKTIHANDVTYPYDYLEATYYGCCGAENAKELLRYIDGRRLMLLSSELGSVSIPNNRSKRYIGFITDNTMKGFEDITDSLCCCIVTYVDPVSLKSQRAIISLKDRNLADSLGPGFIEKFTFSPMAQKDKENYHGGTELDLWSGEGKPDADGYTGFTIDLHAYGDKKVILRLPVTNDRIDASNVKSKWFTVSVR